MIKEAYCSVEVSKLLQKKGFDIPCRAYYNMGALKEDIAIPRDWNHLNFIDHVSAPTQQMVMSWLRINYDIHIGITLECDKKGNMFYFWEILHPDGKHIDVEFSGTGIIYEECIEEAIKYTLENLI